MNLAGVQEMGGMDIQAGDSVNIACGTTLAEIAGDTELAKHAPALVEAAAMAATPQVRAVATVGGNLLQRPRCAYFRDPFFDCLKRGGKTCPSMEGEHDEGAILGNRKCCAVHASNLAVALMALGTDLTISQGVDPKTGPKVRVVPIDGFFVPPEEDPSREARIEPGEVLWMAGVRLAPTSAYVEIDQKQSFDWASASAAVALVMEGTTVKSARIALGHVAPVPLLSEAAAKALVGKAPDAAAARAAGEAAVAGAAPLRDNGHKVQHLKICVQRAVLKAAGRAR